MTEFRHLFPIVRLAALLLVGCGVSTPGSGQSRHTGGGGAAGVGGESGSTGNGGRGGTDGGTTGSGGVAGDGGMAGNASGAGGTVGVGGSRSGDGGASGTSGKGLACPGIEPRADMPGTTCRSDADCGPGLLCSAEPPTITCGTCRPVVRDCENDQGCPDGSLCIVDDTPDPCRCPGELPSRCEPACVADSCAPGERCSQGRCEPIPCTEGFACTERQVCAPERVSRDDHGCAPRNCNEGYVCEAGYACDSQTGNCSAIHCREGGDAICAINQACDDGSAGRGCAPKACAVDADCDCGACIHRCTGSSCGPGACQSRLWVCASIPI